MRLRGAWAGAAAVTLALSALGGCSGSDPTEATVVTTTATVTATPEAQRVGLALAPVESTASFGAEVAAFLQSDIEGLEVDYSDTSDGCGVVIAVFGSQLESGALDYEAYALPTDDCDTDGVATFRRIRDFTVVAEATECFGCDEGVVDDTSYKQLVSVYGNREAVEFEFNEDGELKPSDL